MTTLGKFLFLIFLDFRAKRGWMVSRSSCSHIMSQTGILICHYAATGFKVVNLPHNCYMPKFILDFLIGLRSNFQYTAKASFIHQVWPTIRENSLGRKPPQPRTRRWKRRSKSSILPLKTREPRTFLPQQHLGQDLGDLGFPPPPFAYPCASRRSTQTMTLEGSTPRWPEK